MSERDSDAPPDEGWNDDDAPKSEPPPKPAAEGIRRIDTVIGQHLPALIEEEALKRAAPPPEPKPGLPPREHAAAFERPRIESDIEPGKKWRSPLQVGPDWWVALKSIPPKLVAIAGGGVVLGVLITLAMRGCTENRRVQELDERVALLERTVGVSLDGGRTDKVDFFPVASASDDGGALVAIASATSSAPTNDACAAAKSTAYAAWQDALTKTKQSAAPAVSQCGHILTHDHRQSCLAAATAGVRLVQVARDAVMKGGAAARDAVKNVKDGNGAIAIAKTASQAAFAACPDDNEL